MSKARISLIQSAFKKMDRTSDGYITPEDLKGVYSVKYVRWINSFKRVVNG